MKEIKFTDSAGKKRVGILTICQHCGNEFPAIKRKDRIVKFCCAICRQNASRKRVTLTCYNCHKQFDRKQSALKESRSGIYFCSRKCKTKHQKTGGIIAPDFYGTASYKQEYTPPEYRQHFRDFKCVRCGYDEFKSSVHVHHIDGNNKNNNKNNLTLLCANCHMALHQQQWGLGDIPHGSL